jgi:hypothetical protein
LIEKLGLNKNPDELKHHVHPIVEQTESEKSELSDDDKYSHIGDLEGSP